MELCLWFVQCSARVIGWAALWLRATTLTGLAQWFRSSKVACALAGVCGCGMIGLVERQQRG